MTRADGREIVPASEGCGPLYQRDYWAVIANCRLSPSEVVDVVRERFEEFPPSEIVTFRRVGGGRAPLEVGDEMEGEIQGAGDFAVRVTHRDANSFTLATLRGHPEAGRITFGAYRNPDGDVVFHIRSRARSASRGRFMGFKVFGDPLQTSTWTDFIDRLAALVGSGVADVIHAEKREVEEEPGDRVVPAPPTYVAKGD